MKNWLVLASSLSVVALVGCDSYEKNASSLLLSTSTADIGAGYTSVEIEITADGKPAHRQSYPAADFTSARTLRILKDKAPGATPPSGSLSPGSVTTSGASLQITVRATGTKEPIVHTAKVTFPSESGKLLQMPFLPECAGVKCTIGQSCDRGGNCVSDVIDVAGLPVSDQE